MSVLPHVGSELLTVSDAAAVVCAAPAYEVGNGTLDVFVLRVGQSCLRMDLEDTLLALQDEQSVMSFLVRPAAVLLSQFFPHCRMAVVPYDTVAPVVHGCAVVREMDIPRPKHRMRGN